MNDQKPQEANPEPSPALAATAGSGEMILRRLLAWCYCPVGGLYTDDGEIQDNRTTPFIDFKRDTPEEIERKMERRGMNALRQNVRMSDGGREALK